MGLSCSISTFQKVTSWREPTEGAPGECPVEAAAWRGTWPEEVEEGQVPASKPQSPWPCPGHGRPRLRKAPGLVRAGKKQRGSGLRPGSLGRAGTPPSLPTPAFQKVPLGKLRLGPQHPGGQQRPGAEVNCPPREGHLLTFARVSTTLTSGCFAGYFAMSHSKWVTKDFKSTGRNTFQQVSGTLLASGDQQRCQTPSQAAPLNPRKRSEKRGDRVGAPGKHMLPPTPSGALGQPWAFHQDRQQHPKPLRRTHQWPHLCPKHAQTAAPKVCLREILLPHEAEAGLGEILRARLVPRPPFLVVLAALPCWVIVLF